MKGPRVLIVDYEPQIQRFLRTALRASDYDVIEAATAREALKLIVGSAPDAVLLDLGLPDMDGMDIIREVRVWSKVPIIVLSARDRELDKVAALDLGADDYVEKPFGIGELLARLRAAGLSARIVPPIASTRPLQIDRPRPVPAERPSVLPRR